jgi:mevalonate kinase
MYGLTEFCGKLLQQTSRMRRERITLVGMPTVIAPEAIFLVGELGLPEEKVAVLASVSSHATAQYCSDAVAASPLVSAVVERARDQIGEAAAALPPGSVLLSPVKPRDGEGLAFDTVAAIAVATAAAMFETAGQSISQRKREILLVAQTAHRAIQTGIGAEGELAAALHGGLIKVIFRPDADPRIETLAPPAGLHLVVFRTGQPLFSADWLSCVHQFAERYPAAYSQIVRDLIERAARFATELTEGNVTAAIASAGRYGHCIMQLAAAVSMPSQSAPLRQAIELATQIGGIAKTTSAIHSDLGIAMFATPEAAGLFVRACQPPLVPLRIDLDRSGARRLKRTRQSGEIHTPIPETDPSSISAQAIVRGFLDDDSTDRTLSESEAELCGVTPDHPVPRLFPRWR